MLGDMQYRICETQAELYEYAANNGYKFPEFSDIYMKSSFCHRAMDTIYSRFQLQCPEELMDFILPENPEIKESPERLDTAIAYWIGFTYRQMSFELGSDSCKVLEIWPFDSMLRMYPGMHTQDPEYVAEVMKESIGKRHNIQSK